MILHSLENISNFKKNIEKFRNSFSTLGISETSNTDNRPPFDSGHFQRFCNFNYLLSAKFKWAEQKKMYLQINKCLGNNYSTKKNYALKTCSIKLITSCSVIEIYLKLVNSLSQLKKYLSKYQEQN